jgi:hypothetical protein
MATNFYNANQNLKAAGVSISFTPEQVQEYIKCSQDPIYFIKTYIKIISLDRGLIPFELYDYQAKFITALHENRRIIGMFPRQHGKCLSLNTKVKLKQKSTGKTVEVTLGEFYEWQRFVKHGSPKDLIDMQQMQERKPT